MKMNKLTVIVPAYKTDFLAEALRSILGQSVIPDRIIVFDDASPYPVRDIVSGFGGSVEYYRFEANLGGRDLVSHWDRCIKKVDSEWVWLFSDDDVADNNCVELFLQGVDNCSQIDLFRFDTRIIDAESVCIELCPPNPQNESPADFLYFRLRGQRSSFVPNYIFRRERWLAIGGFVNFQRAWCSDDATWAVIAEKSGIYTVNKAKVAWRMSGQNISSGGGVGATQKYQASIAFSRWVLEWQEKSGNEILNSRWIIDQWLIRQINVIGARPPIWYLNLVIDTRRNGKAKRTVLLARSVFEYYLKAFLKFIIIR